jgi:hypothetical protein
MPASQRVCQADREHHRRRHHRRAGNVGYRGLGWITEASTLIEGYLRHTYTADETVPDAARIVCARVVARALTTPVTTPNADRYDSTMGPFTASTQVTRDALGGGVWLTRQDKMALDSIPGEGLTNRSMIPLMTPASGG